MRAFLVMVLTVACMVGLSTLVTPALAAVPTGVAAMPQPEATKTKKAKKKPKATPTPCRKRQPGSMRVNTRAIRRRRRKTRQDRWSRRHRSR